MLPRFDDAIDIEKGSFTFSVHFLGCKVNRVHPSSLLKRVWLVALAYFAHALDEGDGALLQVVVEVVVIVVVVL